MSEVNKSVLRRFTQECVNSGNFAHLDELVAADFTYHEPTVGDKHGRKELEQLLKMYRSAFPDMQFSLDELVGEGNLVAARWSCVGTHRGELFGIKPTNKRCRVEGQTICRFANGKLEEQYETWDVYGLLQQLGAIPSAVKTAA